MKKLLIFSLIMVGWITAYSQVPNEFGITVRTLDQVQIENNVRDTLTVVTDLMYIQFYKNRRVVFGYDVHYYKHDSIIVRTEKNVRETVPLNVNVTAAGQTKTVLEWIQMTRTAQDTAIIRMLAGRLARYKSIGALTE